MEIGERIKFLREQQNLSVNALAHLAGISQSHLRDIELGNKNPTVDTLSFFCDALGVSLTDFFNEECELNPALVTALRKLNPSQQLSLAEFINSMNEKQ